MHPERRQDIFLATKFGAVWKPAADGGPPTLEINNSPEYVRQACERSLSRLGVDQIDLYYIHRLNKDTPIELPMRVMAELKK